MRLFQEIAIQNIDLVLASQPSEYFAVRDTDGLTYVFQVTTGGLVALVRYNTDNTYQHKMPYKGSKYGKKHPTKESVYKSIFNANRIFTMQHQYEKLVNSLKSSKLKELV